MFKTIIAILAILLLIFIILGFYLFLEFGKTPTSEETREYEKLSYFKDGKFISPQEIKIYPKKMKGGYASLLKFIFVSEHAPPSSLPIVDLNKESFSQKPEDFSVYWLGHSTVILELNGKRILIDPVFGNAAPIPLVAKRYGDSPLNRDELPDLNYVLISHNHYDHLERSTIKALRDKDIKFIVPLGVGAILRGWKVPKNNIIELGWDDSYQDGSIEIIAASSLHYTSRKLKDRNKTLWNSYVIQGQQKKVYFSGDTGYYDIIFKEIGNKHGPFDLALLEIDAWNEAWPNMHLFPDQVIQLSKDIGVKEVVPIHWGVFDLGSHPWDESIKIVTKLGKDNGTKISTPMMGEKFLPGISQTKEWWIISDE